MDVEAIACVAVVINGEDGTNEVGIGGQAVGHTVGIYGSVVTNHIVSGRGVGTVGGMCTQLCESILGVYIPFGCPNRPVKLAFLDGHFANQGVFIRSAGTYGPVATGIHAHNADDIQCVVGRGKQNDRIVSVKTYHVGVGIGGIGNCQESSSPLRMCNDIGSVRCNARSSREDEGVGGRCGTVGEQGQGIAGNAFGSARGVVYL